MNVFLPGFFIVVVTGGTKKRNKIKTCMLSPYINHSILLRNIYVIYFPYFQQVEEGSQLKYWLVSQWLLDLLLFSFLYRH